MKLESVLLFAPSASATTHEGPVAYAIRLARQNGARLTSFVVDLDVTTPGRNADPLAAAALIERAALEAGVDCVTVTEHSHALGIHEVIAEHARLHDLTVMGCHGDGLLSERAVLEHLLFDSGRPVVVVPHGQSPGDVGGPALVAWDNTAAAARALGDARLLLRSGEELLFLTIGGEKPVQCDLNPDQLVAASARRGLRARAVRAELGERSIAEALQQEAKAHGAQLLVMGAYGHSRWRQIVLGSATAGVLANLHMPVLMSH